MNLCYFLIFVVGLLCLIVAIVGIIFLKMEQTCFSKHRDSVCGAICRFSLHVLRFRWSPTTMLFFPWQSLTFLFANCNVRIWWWWLPSLLKDHNFSSRTGPRPAMAMTSESRYAGLHLSPGNSLVALRSVIRWRPRRCLKNRRLSSAGSKHFNTHFSRPCAFTN